MIRRIIAAVVALALAGVGAFLIMGYASAADERALQGLETVDVLVATQRLEEGTTADQLATLVETKAVPRAYVVTGSVANLAELEGRQVTAPVEAGEQLVSSRFATPEEIRAADDFQLPEEAENLHQVTIPLDKPRALGGDIAAGDLVGVFVSLTPEEDASEEEDGPAAVNMTHLTLHKVLVVRVQGGYVAPPPAAAEGEETEAREPADTVLVTLALPAPDAEKLVFAMEFGQVWLSYEPDGADENGTDVVVATIPDAVRALWR